MFKFEIGDIVKKSAGYKFEGRIVSRYEVEGGIRYDVQVDGTFAFDYLTAMYVDGPMNEHDYDILSDAIMNCHGMIHIFAESQLELKK